MADFQTALKMVLDHEGGYQSLVSDAGNVGGYGTNRGITYATLKDWYNKQGKGVPSQLDVKNLTLAETAEIYQAFYWRRIGGDLLQDQNVATVLFDVAVLMGPASLIINAQFVAAQASGQPLTNDGVMGPKTLAIINSLKRRNFLEPICYRLQGILLNYVAARPDNLTWERTWMRRASDWLCLIY